MREMHDVEMDNFTSSTCNSTMRSVDHSFTTSCDIIGVQHQHWQEERESQHGDALPWQHASKILSPLVGRVAKDRVRSARDQTVLTNRFRLPKFAYHTPVIVAASCAPNAPVVTDALNASKTKPPVSTATAEGNVTRSILHCLLADDPADH
jgi:hypothetical protein